MHEKEIFKEFPIIKTAGFLLREITLEDADDFLEYMTNNNVSKFLSVDDLPKNLTSSYSELAYWRGLFQSKRSIYWGIEIDKHLVGTCGYNSWSTTNKRCEISYDLSYSYWGRGIMTKAIEIITDFAFINMKVNRIQATVAEDNIGSVKVLENNGFRKEATLKKFGILNNVVKDFYMYAKVR